MPYNLSFVKQANTSKLINKKKFNDDVDDDDDDYHDDNDEEESDDDDMIAVSCNNSDIMCQSGCCQTRFANTVIVIICNLSEEGCV